MLKFNLGTMRVGYTPLTIATPNPDFIFEPKIFADRRAEAMADRYLDGSEKRLMQGLNAELNFKAGPIDSVYIQTTLARLRNNAKKIDQLFFDYDANHDRYAAAARLGLELYGIRIGASDVYSFDRVRSSRITTLADVMKKPIDHEYNNVLSFEGGLNSKKWLTGSFGFGLNAELAISNWMYYRDILDTVQTSQITLGAPAGNTVSLPCMNCSEPTQGGTRYPYYAIRKNTEYRNSKIDESINQAAFLADVFVEYADNSLEAKLSGHYLKTDIGFESELAANPSYVPQMPILNSNAAYEASEFDAVLSQFRSGSLENLYFSLYYTLPLNAATMLASDPDAATVPGPVDGYLANNYKFGQYYRNAYSYRAYTRLEREGIDLDPSVNMALPYGYATPDRQGGDVDFSIIWNNAILFRGVFGQYASEVSDYTRFGGGLSVKLESLAGLPKPLDISVSYEQNSEKKGSERETARIMAGFDAGIWRGLSLLGGIQLLDKKFGVSYGGFVEKTSEMLVLGGPSVKISEKAFFVLQGGLLSNSISAVGGAKLDIDKYIASANVQVGF
jgi:hypothetical protein